MKAQTRGVILGLVVLVVLGIALWLARRGGEATTSPTGQGNEPAGTQATAQGGGTRDNARPDSKQSQAQAPSPGGPSKPKEVIAELAWGSGPSELGRERPQEASPEAPMSLAADALGNIVVLDQINGRLVRLDSEGKVVGSFEMTQQTPQDITMAKDGTLLVLDRLRDKTVAIMDPDTGRLLGELPVGGKGIPEPGLVTGTFVDGDSVYVEREHGALVRIGDTSGKADTERSEIPGRPTRDGRFYILAGIVDRASGRVFLNLVDRQTGQHRSTREYALQLPLMYINLLDSDLSGVIYLGVVGEVPTGKAEPATQPGVRVYCIEPLEGKVLGQADLPANTMPEETFRDLYVLDGGGIVYKHLTESGVTLMRASCR